MQKLMSVMRSAMEHYNMIEEGSRLAVGVSGGKDSLVLLAALQELRRFYPKKYELCALTLDPCFDNQEGDFGAVADFCRERGISYHIHRTKLYEVIFQIRQEKNPCSLCARMRRGILHDQAKALGCTHVALGHHLDDAAETFYMNLFCGGRIGCFSPRSYLSRKELTLIRPMVYAREKDVARVARKLCLPVVKSRCPVDGCTGRERFKELLEEWEHSHENLREKTIGALEKAGVDGWYVAGKGSAQPEKERKNGEK